MHHSQQPIRLNGDIEPPDDFPDDDFDPERIVECGYWRCGELFEARTANHQFCRKACRSRQRKWERAQQRRERRARSSPPQSTLAEGEPD